MSEYASKHMTFLIGKESTYGTAVTTDRDVGEIQSVDPVNRNNLLRLHANGAREAQHIIPMKAEFGFDIELFLQHGRPLEYVFGSVAHAQTTSDWKHTFSVATELPSFTTEYSFNKTTDAVFAYAGCKFNTATISVTTGGVLTFRGNAIAKTVDVSDTSASTAVISTLSPLASFQADVLIGASGSETSLADTQSWELSVNNTATPLDILNSRTISKLTANNLQYDIQFTQVFQSLDEYKRFLDGTTTGTAPDDDDWTGSSIILTANNNVNLGSGRREFYAKFAVFKYDEVTPPTRVGEVVIATFRAIPLALTDAYYVDNVSDTAW